jgi:hypothetical protein
MSLFNAQSGSRLKEVPVVGRFAFGLQGFCGWDVATLPESGDGWQTRVDAALREWLKKLSPA